MTRSRSTTPPRHRLRIASAVLFVMLGAIASRLFYWQIIKGTALRAQAATQYERTFSQQVSRGKIFTSDGYLLVGNKEVYRLYMEPKLFSQDPASTSKTLTEILLPEYIEYEQATESATREAVAATIQATMTEKLSRTDASWVGLKAKISESAKAQIEALAIEGIGFEPYEVRSYPEASMSAHVTGFVGKNNAGEDTGYFGVEGALDQELKGKTVQQIRQADAFGLNLFIGTAANQANVDGRDVVLTIRRDVQAMVEEQLEEAVKRYGAKSGEVIVLDPQTGKVLAMAGYPRYDQEKFYEYDPSLYKNPTLASVYEPGSTLKTLTVSAGLDVGAIEPDTKCPNCDGPVQIGQYTIKTWNNEYHPETTMTEALANSDNTAMIYIANQVGKDSFIEYLQRFGIGQELHIDLQEDSTTPWRDRWGDIHLATASFGQGIVTNSLQLTRAVAAIANQGVMMRPMIVEKVIDSNQQREIEIDPVIERRVISPEAAQQTSQMMVEAAAHGEAQWIASKRYTIAGKTGTSQVAAEGGYDAEKTIASFIGFAPVHEPAFVMMVKLVEPQSSPWAAETAAPLWYNIANDLFLLFSIPPDK